MAVRYPKRGRPVARVTPDLMAFLAERLTDRDRRVVRYCHDHRVLTTGQITRLAFGSASHARARLDQLARWRVLDRARPFTQVGSAPWHYVLGPAGARVIAAEDGGTVADLGWRRDHAIDVVFSRQIGHILGVNDFFTALTEHARQHDDTKLLAWWPQRRCAAEHGTYVRPDAYGHWRDDDAQIRFFLEYDTGTEPAGHVAAKLTDYAELTTVTGQNTPVLFAFHGPRREAHLRRLMAEHPDAGCLAIATTHMVDSAVDIGSPTGPVWQPLDRTGPRIRLADLARHFPAPGEPSC